MAALLTVLTPGLGHIYIGEARRGITLFILVMIADTLLMFAMMGVLARFWMFAVSLSLLAGLWLYIMVDAVRRASQNARLPASGRQTMDHSMPALSWSPASCSPRPASMPSMPRRRANSWC